MIIYLQYAIGIYLISLLLLLPLFSANGDSTDKLLKPLPLAVSFILLYYGFHFIVNTKITGNALYEMDLSMTPYWVPFLLGSLCIVVGFKFLYEGYIKKYLD